MSGNIEKKLSAESGVHDLHSAAYAESRQFFVKCDPSERQLKYIALGSLIADRLAIIVAYSEKLRENITAAAEQQAVTELERIVRFLLGRKYEHIST